MLTCGRIQINLEYMEYGPSPQNLERSLLQKAIRRGNVELVEKVVKYLISKGDFDWLRKRLAVITYEECWTLGTELRFDKNEHIIIEQYKNLALAVKNKNAAGLASLAMQLDKKNKTSDEVKAIETIANAMDNKEEFWDWIKTEPGYQKHKRRIELAKEHVTKAVYPTDKAQMFAAAYLCGKELVPETKFTQPDNDPNFPYWIAFDKHTELGRMLIEKAAKKIGCNYYEAARLAFYFEGSVTKQLTDSPYWEHILTFGNDASKTWNELKPILIDISKDHAKALEERINKPIPKKEDPQLSLF